jgi:phosphoglycerate kinase
MKLISEANLTGKRALIRVDFNVPLNAELQITDDKRMREALPTIQYILNAGGSVVLMSHLGRPKKGPEDKFSLTHLVKPLSEMLGREVKFAGDCISAEAFAITAEMKPGDVVLLENLRFYKEEEAGETIFAEKLARHGDLYVNDAFGTAHRAHASTTIVAHFHPLKYSGFLLAKEIENANKLLHNPARPFTAIMGGAKVSDKIMLIDQLLEKVDNLLIGGGMAYTFLKAKGYPIGKSLVEEDKVALAAALIKKARGKNVTIITPIDSVVADKFAVDAKTAIVRNDDFPADYMGLDIGPGTYSAFHDVIHESKTILWNGPMGVFEMAPFAQGTLAVAKALAEATKNGAFTLIGGGDSAAAIAQCGLEDEVSYVSTGGGALLEYIEGKTLPGVAALE